MITIDNILIDDDIATSHFSCDLGKCNGGCCTFPGKYGAPVLDEEIDLIKESLDAALVYMPEVAKKALKEKGFAVGDPGEYTTYCINDRDCVFVYYDGEIALCALERAYKEGKSKFWKPISCHLFPIRVGRFGGPYLYYEKIEECEPAVRLGKKNGIMMHEAVKDAIIRAYGEDWYKELEDFVKNDGK